MNENRIENEFICINSSVCVKVGNVEVSDSKAGYVIEVLDWCGTNINDVLKDMRTLNGVKSALLSFNDEGSAVIISPKQFHQEATLQLIKLAETIDLTTDKTVALTFQMNEDRSALFRYLVAQRQEALKLQTNVDGMKDVTAEASTTLAGNA
jgi:hypothetical protein